MIVLARLYIVTVACEFLSPKSLLLIVNNLFGTVLSGDSCCYFLNFSGNGIVPIKASPSQREYLDDVRLDSLQYLVKFGMQLERVVVPTG
jgi:hypothetical protein